MSENITLKIPKRTSSQQTGMLAIFPVSSLGLNSRFPRIPASESEYFRSRGILLNLKDLRSPRVCGHRTKKKKKKNVALWELSREGAPTLWIMRLTSMTHECICWGPENDHKLVSHKLLKAPWQIPRIPLTRKLK